VASFKQHRIRRLPRDEGRVRSRGSTLVRNCLAAVASMTVRRDVVVSRAW